MGVLDELAELILANVMVSVGIGMTEGSTGSPAAKTQAHTSESSLELILAEPAVPVGVVSAEKTLDLLFRKGET